MLPPRCVPGAALLAAAAAQHVYKQPTFGVRNSTDILYAQGLKCNKTQYGDPSGCTPMDLLLDVYEPVAQSLPVPELKPAYILAHGGGNSGGSKEQFCFQGAAEFYAARGFVGFNINYRLAHDHGLLPARAPPPPAPPAPAPARAGDGLVSHVERSTDRFFPHPDRGNTSGSPRTGPLRLGGDDGALCITVGGAVGAASAARVLTLESCAAGAAAQQWTLAHWTIAKQRIVHNASAYCLDIPDAGAAPAAGLPVRAAPCADSPAQQDSTQLWQLGYSGALIVRGGAMAVAVDRPLPADEVGAGVELQWKPGWASGYPAVRDCKAAVRFVRANAARWGVDPGRIAVSGGSAGATDMLAVGATYDGDYKDELTPDEDATLASTHLNVTSAVQCVVAHWSSGGEISLAQQQDPQNRTRFSAANAPVVEFHGDKDTTIPITEAEAVQRAYAQTGVPYELHTLKGCGHGAWCYDGNGTCGCSNGVQGYGSLMDETALPFVATSLQLQLL